MNVLIVESRPALGKIWQRHLERQGMDVVLATTQAEAVRRLQADAVDIIILDLVIQEGAALAVSDYASYSQPEAQVIFVTNTSFFSDGSIFAHSANARAFVPSGTAPEDLTAIVEHFGTERQQG